MLYKVALPTNPLMVVDGIDTYIVEAVDADAALVLVQGYRANDNNSLWDNATSTSLEQDLEGLVFTIATTGTGPDVAYTGVSGDTWEEVAAGLETLLDAAGFTATWTIDATSGIDGIMVTALGNAVINATAEVIVSGGGGYLATDVLTLVGGTSTTAGTLTVDTVTDDGVATVSITEAGTYTAKPGNDVAVTGGGGTLADFTLVWDEKLTDTTLAVAAGGTGYSVDDVLTLVGGTSTTTATAKVTAESGGVVTAVEVVEPGDYTVVPGDPVATTGGAGDCTLTAATAWRYFVKTVSSVATAGGGYQDADEVTLVGGTQSEACIITVTTTVNGVITVAVVKAATDGKYSVVPSNPVSVTGGGGTAATFTMTWAAYDNVGDETMTVTVADPAANDLSAGFIDEVTSGGAATADLSFVLLSTGTSNRVIGAYKGTL